MIDLASTFKPVPDFIYVAACVRKESLKGMTGYEASVGIRVSLPSAAVETLFARDRTVPY